MRLGSALLIVVGFMLSGLVGRPAQALDFEAELRRLDRQVDQSRKRVQLTDRDLEPIQVQSARSPSSTVKSAEPGEAFEVQLIAKRNQHR